MKVIILTSLSVALFCLSAAAQVNTDSLALVNKISEYQLKMGKLQNEINQKTDDKQKDSLVAQQSATTNANAANNLNANPDDKKDARKADNTAGEAKTDARKARHSSANLDKINKSILELQYKIAKEQVKLNRFTHQPYAPVMAMSPALPDSVQHP